MRSSAPRLLEALGRDRRSNENRLTELFATALVANPQLASRLLEEAGLSATERVEARTMVWTGDGLQNVDMELLAIRDVGGVESRLWSEHKIDSPLGPTQPEDYLAALRRRDGKGHLMVIVDSEQQAQEAEGRGFRALTWQLVGDWIDEIGQAWASGHWRDAALEPDAPARWRVLEEFLWHLEEEGVTVVSPLDSTLVAAFKYSARAEETIADLIERAGRQLHPFSISNDSAEGELLFEAPSGLWGSQAEPALYLSADSDDGWAVAPEGTPAFGAGITMDANAYDPLREKVDWIASLEQQGFGFYVDDDGLWCLRSLPMERIASAEKSIANQARELATWTREAFESIVALDPGPFEMPPRGRRKKTAREENSDGDDDASLPSTIAP